MEQGEEADLARHPTGIGGMEAGGERERERAKRHAASCGSANNAPYSLLAAGGARSAGGGSSGAAAGRPVGLGVTRMRPS